MNSDISLFALKKNYDSAIAGLIGVLLIFFYSRHGGIGLSPDSIVYISTARSVVHGGGFFEFEGIPITDFPMGYPAFLSIILFITRIDLVQSGNIINMVLYFALIYLSGGIINHISTKNKWVKIPFLFLIVFSPALLSVYTMLWSETLFLVMILIFFVALHRYGKEKTISTLVVVAIIAGLSCVVRYAGITLVGAGGLLILLDRKLQIGKKLVHLTIFGSIGIFFLAANLFRNYLVTGMLTGDREKSLTTLYQNIQNYAYVFSDFFYFRGFPVFFVILTGVSFIIFYLYSHIINLYKTNRYYNYWNICGSFFIVYSLFMVLSATFSRYETLNTRLLSPLYLPCLLPFTFVITWMISKLKRWKKYSLISFFVLLFGVINFYQYEDNYDLWDMAKDSGIPGYAEDCWKNSPIIDYIKRDKVHFKEDTQIYSDGNEAIYLFTGLSADLIPHVESKADNADFKEDQQNDYYLVWFYENESPELLSLRRLLKENYYVEIASSPDGCIYHHPAPDKNPKK
jgi:preprotein translocase subunit Sec61beta